MNMSYECVRWLKIYDVIMNMRYDYVSRCLVLEGGGGGGEVSFETRGVRC